MAYRIEYGPAIPEKYQKKYQPLRLQILTAVFLLLFVLLVKQFFPAGIDTLRAYLLPGSQNLTQTALNTFVTDIRSGDPIRDAIFAFCEELIAHEPALSD